MNRFIRGLLSGASFAALNFGIFAGTARAAGITVSNGSTIAGNETAAGTNDFIWVKTGGVVDGNVVNEGTLGPSGGTPNAAIEINGVVEGNVANSATINATGTQWGIEVAGAGASVSGVIINDENIFVHHAGSGGGGIHVAGSAFVGAVNNSFQIKVTGTGKEFGVLQSQVRGSSSGVTARFINQGSRASLTVSAARTALGGATSQHQLIVGGNQPLIQQSVSNTRAGSGYGWDRFTNQHQVKLVADTNLAASNSASASARLGTAVAILQTAHGHSAYAELQNSGDIKIQAIAQARAGEEAKAYAFSVGLRQSVDGTSTAGGSATARLAVQSSGALDIYATAVARASGLPRATPTSGAATRGVRATAHAVVSKAIVQNAHDAQNITDVVNVSGAHGAISIKAVASAFHSTHTATQNPGGNVGALASAEIRTALRQQASTAAHAKLSLQNHGLFKVQIQANATAQSGFAHAAAFQIGGTAQRALVQQSAYDMSVADATLINHGTLAINVTAHATADTGQAIARVGKGVDFNSIAGGFTGILQTLHNISSGHAKITNFHDLTIQGSAAVHGSGQGIASAHIGVGIAQRVRASSESNAAAGLVNRGDLLVRARALAQGGGVVQSAHAILKQGIAQSVRAGSGGSISAHATLSNVAGTLDISVTAHASRVHITSAMAGQAHANASIAGGTPAGIRQAAHGVNGLDRLANDGDLGVKLSAVASGRATVAASAKLSGVGITQSVQATDGHGTAQLTNNGALMIKAHAVGHAAGGSANAWATIGTGIRQQVSAPTLAKASIVNSHLKHLTIKVSAFAGGATNSAHQFFLASKANATATIGNGIYQQAQDAALATAELHNSGVLDIHVTASADGRTNAGAKATVHGGIHQQVLNAGSAMASLVNHADIHIGARAVAGESSNAHASAKVSQGILQSAGGLTIGHAYVLNDGTISVSALASAHGSGNATADARVHAIAQNARGTHAFDELHNSGQLHVKASALGGGSAAGDRAYATAHGVSQQATGDVSAHASMVNSGLLAVTAKADIIGGSNVSAYAGVLAVEQAPAVTGISGTGHATFVNHGTLSARASATRDAAGSRVQAFAVGVSQILGMNQFAHAAALVSNDGIIAVKALASGVADTAGRVTARALGVVQSATGRSAGVYDLTLRNSGSLKVTASALDNGAASIIKADAIGVEMFADDNSNVVAHVANSAAGRITAAAFAQGANAKATAVGIQASGKGSNYSYLSLHSGVVTRSSANFHPAALDLEAVNSGSLKVKATVSGAGGNAHATGIVGRVTNQTSGQQSYTSGGASPVYHSSTGHDGGALIGNIANDGNLLVTAKAASGKARAVGIALTGATINVAVSNSKNAHLTVQATGKTASATGLRLRDEHRHTSQVGGGTVSQTHSSTAYRGAVVHGAIENDGSFKVTAKAGAGAAVARGIWVQEAAFTPTLRNKGNITVVASGAHAVASGIRLSGSTIATVRSRTPNTTGGHPLVHHTSTVNTPSHNTLVGTVENDGIITVTAKAATGAVAKGIVIDGFSFTGSLINTKTIKAEADGAGGQAVAILISDSAAPPSGPGTISNIGGTISAKLVNGGVTTWGTAIDVSNAPNAMNIGLSGNGNIYGNVKLKSNSAVTVSGAGVTFFSGVINPSKTKTGTLTIAAGGNLELANDAAQGNAKAYVTTFTQLGTLSVDIGSVANATPYINAGAATLGGALVVVPGTALPASNTTFKIVASDAALSTTWSGVSIKGNPALLSASASYLPNEADIVWGLTPAGTLGLTDNQLAVLTPFEKTLATILGSASIDPNSAMGKLITALFTLTLPQLTDVLDQLGDLDAGAQAQANLSFASSLLSQILDHLGAGTTGGGGVASLQSTPAGVRPAQMTTGAGTIWGGIYGAHASTRSVPGSPGSGTTVTGLMAGYDVALNTDLLAGLVGSYSTDTSKTGGGHASANGFQVSPYFQLTRDSGFFARGSLSYGNYNNKVSRTVTVPGFGTGTLGGKFNSDVYSAYLEAGQKFVTDDGTAVSPYAALGYARSASGAYTETGFAGPALTVNSAVAQTLTSYLGVGFEKSFALGDTSLLPHIRIAWAHDYSGSAWQVAAQFAALPGSGFVINGPSLSRDKAYINAGVSMHLSDDVETSLNYDALFNNDQSQQSLMGVLRFSF